MNIQDNLPHILNKTDWLKDLPVFSNTVVCHEIYSKSCDMAQMHFHEFVEISIVVQGEGVHLSLNGASKCKAGDVYIINTGVPHEYFAENEEKKPTVCNLLFDPSDIFSDEIAMSETPRYCYGVFRENPLTAHMELEPDKLTTVKNITAGIQKEISCKMPEWKSCVRAHLETLLIELSRCRKNPESNQSSGLNLKDRFTVSKVMNIILKRYSDTGLTLESIASSMFISKSYLSRIFTKATGKYFSDYLRDVRLKNACRFLRETDKTNEQIAHKCGIKDLPTFYRLFKANLAMTPNQYRQNKD